MHETCHHHQRSNSEHFLRRTAKLAAINSVSIAAAVVHNGRMRAFVKPAFVLCLALFSMLAQAANPILETAERHARMQAQGLPGEVSVRADPLDPNTQLPACTSLQAYTPSGSRQWGKTHVGVRCLAPQQWNILVSVQISVINSYAVTTRPLAAGQTIQAGDLSLVRGDLAGLPAGIVTDLSTTTGKTLKNSLAAGQALRSDQLLAPLLIKQGQSVKLQARGPGFTVSSEGKAMNNAAAGQVAQIRLTSGQTTSGIVLDDGSVEINR